jgi:hypothetical protein
MTRSGKTQSSPSEEDDTLGPKIRHPSGVVCLDVIYMKEKHYMTKFSGAANLYQNIIDYSLSASNNSVNAPLIADFEKFSSFDTHGYRLNYKLINCWLITTKTEFLGNILRILHLKFSQLLFHQLSIQVSANHSVLYLLSSFNLL